MEEKPVDGRRNSFPAETPPRGPAADPKRAIRRETSSTSEGVPQPAIQDSGLAQGSRAKIGTTDRGESRADATVKTFGERVRLRRERADQTLGQLSQRSGVSPAMLSKVERGEKSPTIGIAKRIAHALGTPLSVLMADEVERRAFALVEKGQRQTFRDAGTGFERHLLSPIMAGLAVEVVLHRLPPRASTGKLPYPQGTGKHVVAARGKIIVGFDAQEVTLEEGDTLYFEADHDHWFTNPTDSTSEYYLVLSPSTRNDR